MARILDHLRNIWALRRLAGLRLSSLAGGSRRGDGAVIPSSLMGDVDRRCPRSLLTVDFPPISAGSPEADVVAASVSDVSDRDLSRRAGLANAGPSDARTQGGTRRNGVTGTHRGHRSATRGCATDRALRLPSARGSATEEFVSHARRRQDGAATMGAVAPYNLRGHRTPEMGRTRSPHGPAAEASSRGALPRTASELRSLHSTNAKERVMQAKEENRGSEKLQMELA